MKFDASPLLSMTKYLNNITFERTAFKPGTLNPNTK